MSAGTHERRPGGNGTALEEIRPGGSAPILGETPDSDEDDAAPFRECYAILVRGKSIRRHPYFNLPAAERQVRRARARGDVATMVLVRLEPVEVGR